MTPAWQQEITITETIARQCIETQFPELGPLSNIHHIGEGWDNVVYLINDTLIFRFPRRHIATGLIERENAVLPQIQFLGDLIPIPDPTYVGRPSDTFPHPFHGYRELAGRDACHTVLSDVQRRQCVPQLATFLKQLHNIDAATAASMGALEPVFNRMDFEIFSRQLRERVISLKESIPLAVNIKAFEDEIENTHPIVIEPTSRVLVHGDLYCRHLLFDKGRLSGIIDWCDICINHPAVDLMVVFDFLPEECWTEFFNIYGEVFEATWQYARFLAIYHALTRLLYATKTGETQLATESQSSLNKLNPKLLTGKL